MNTTPYKPEDYVGEFNLLQAEKDLLIKVGKMVKNNQRKMSYIVGVSERTINTKLRRHKIS